MQVELNQLKNIFQSAFGERVEITEDTKKDDLELWDSINHLNLIVELEEQLSLSFTKNEIEHLNSVQALIDMIQLK